MLVGYDSQYEYVFVAFRGSYDVQNYIDDLDALLTAPYSDDKSAANVMAGLWDEYKKLYEDVYTAMQATALAYSTTKLALTGHSSGGGCATLLAFDVARGAVDGFTATDIKYVTTFGSPRVGDPTFAAEYDAYNLNSARVTHYQDVVVGWVHHRRLL